MLHRLTLSIALIVPFALLSGCETEQSYAEKKAAEWAAIRPDAVMVIRHHVGGTHHRTLVRGDLWYATFSNDLLVMSAQTGTVLTSVEIMPFGTCGGVTELIAPEGSDLIYVLLDGTAVCEVSLASPRAPEVTAIRRTAEIGFAPRAISIGSNRLWIGGDGGVVSWSDVQPPGTLPSALPADGPDRTKTRDELLKKHSELGPPPALLADAARDRGSIGAVVGTAQGLAAVSGRRVLKLDDGSFIGAATRLDALPSQVAGRLGLPGGFTFILQGSEAAQVGLMGPDVREVASRAVKGTVRRVRVLGDTLFALNDEEMVLFPIEVSGDGVRLGDPAYAAVKGARDVDAISSNDFVVVGSFGRAFWRRMPDSRGPGDEFYGARREPSGLTVATTDRRRILAGGPEGSWLYTVGDEVSLVNRPLLAGPGVSDGRKQSVSSGWGKATIGDDKRSVRVVASGQAALDANASSDIIWNATLGGEIFGVEALDGRLWIWHADGVDVLTVSAGVLHPDASVRMEGPVRFLLPQRVGGAAAFVSEFGGFGLLDFIERETLPSIPGERVVDRDGDGNCDVELTDAEKAGASRGFESKPMDMRPVETR